VVSPDVPQIRLEPVPPRPLLAGNLPIVVDAAVALAAAATLLHSDVEHGGGWGTPIALLAIAAYFVLGVLGRRTPRIVPLALAAVDALIVIAVIGSGAPSATAGLVILGASFRAGTHLGRRAWRAFVAADVVVFAIVEVRTPQADHPALAIELTAFFFLALIFVQAVVLYADAARRGYAALAEAHDELRRHVERIGELAALRERERLAADVHDAVGHELTILALQLEGAALQLEEHPALPGVRRAHATALGVLGNVRLAVHRIRTDPLERAPLDEAIRAVCRNAGDGGAVELRLDALPLPALSAGRTTHVVNVVREAISNALRHGRAQTVRVEAVADRGAVNVVIADDGCGFVPEVNTHGNGLRGMRSRAGEVGGELYVVSAPGGGTVVRLRVPVEG
jgi:signal transduction histidine kinase